MEKKILKMRITRNGKNFEVMNELDGSVLSTSVRTRIPETMLKSQTSRMMIFRQNSKRYKEVGFDMTDDEDGVVFSCTSMTAAEGRLPSPAAMDRLVQSLIRTVEEAVASCSA